MTFNITKCAVACILLLLNFTAANAAPVPGGSLDPLSIPKFVTPLFIPPVLYDDDGKSMTIDIALRQINQQVLPEGFPATPLWAYGSPTNPESFNNPGFTIETTKDSITQVTWINQLVDANNNYLPHIIQDSDGYPIVDQTLLWANPAQDCRDGLSRTDCRGASEQPYTGPVPMVMHVHGAHVGPISDGYPEAWWLPAANNIPAGYASEGTTYDDINGGAPGTGTAVYQYTNDQPTSTLWYHDNTLGMTRLNRYAAGTGFWLIRDSKDTETGLVSGILPGPAAILGDDPNCSKTNGNGKGKSKGKGKGKDKCIRQNIREIPIAIQPKSFNTDGTQFYPADRAFFEGLGTGAIFADNTDVNMPFLPQLTSDIAPVWNPEAFFNTMVVNGNTWPLLEVAQERYRLRLLNASDSRFLNLSLFVVNEEGGYLEEELPFYQIGSEQGLLPAVVRIEYGFATTLPGDGRDVGSGVTPEPGTFAEQALLVGPGERPDVIIDFTGLADGTIVRMINTAPDAPFGGFPDVPADPGTTGQVMQFVVNQALNSPGGDHSTPTPSLVLNTNSGGVPKLGSSSLTRDLALYEEESALVCVTIDPFTGRIDQDPNSIPLICDPVLGSMPFAPMKTVFGSNGSSGSSHVLVLLWDDPIDLNPNTNATETWELWNWSADAHPIHLHQVKFEVVNRETIYGAIRPAEPWENGWKDTVIAYPGEVTRVKARFDIPGLYIWHSNILSHRDNQMIRPYCVGTPGVDCPARLF